MTFDISQTDNFPILARLNKAKLESQTYLKTIVALQSFSITDVHLKLSNLDIDLSLEYKSVKVLGIKNPRSNFFPDV